MPLTEIRLGREKTLTGLANRLFVFEGPGAAAQKRRAEAALLKANPALARAESFTSGATVVVPQVQGLTRKEAAPKGRPDLSDAVDSAAGQIRIGATQLAARIKDARAGADAQLERLADRDLRKLAKAALPDSDPLFEAAKAGIPERLRQTEERGEALLRAMQDASEKLGELGGKLRRQD